MFDTRGDSVEKQVFAVIPECVLHDKELPAQAKLIYGEISALCAKKGFCWATNAYFAELYGVSASSVKRWIKTLIDKGYIDSEVENRNERKLSVKSEFRKKTLSAPVGGSEMNQGRFKNEPGGGSKMNQGRFKNEPPPKPASPTESKAEGQFFSPNNTYNNTMNNTCSSGSNSIYNNNNDNDDKKTSQEGDDGWTEAMDCYQDNIHPITGTIELDMLRDMFDTYGKAWMTEAIKEAVGSSRGAPSLRYIEAILQRWKRDGFKAERKPKMQVVGGKEKSRAELIKEEALRLLNGGG